MTLVTGGAGFVGRHLVVALRASGERVRVLDLAAPQHNDDIQGSILDERAVTLAMQGVRSVFHLAGNAQLWARRKAQFDDVNHLGTKIIAAVALEAGVERLVHCSSLTTLVSRAAPIGVSSVDEAVSYEPRDMLGDYPRSKLLAERRVTDAIEAGLDAVIAIPTEPLGPGDVSFTPPTKMVLDFANGNTPAYIDCVLNFVPVDSLADGLIAARDRGACGERYLLGGENIKMRDLLTIIEDVSGRRAPKTRMPYWVALAAGFVDTKIVSGITGKPPTAPLTGVRLAGRQVLFSSEKAARDLHWRAGPTEPALREAIDWFRDNGLLNSV